MLSRLPIVTLRLILWGQCPLEDGHDSLHAGQEVVPIDLLESQHVNLGIERFLELLVKYVFSCKKA